MGQDLIFFFLKYQFLPVLSIAFKSQATIFKLLAYTKSLSFGKTATSHQDLWGISANVNNFLDSSQLILSQTLPVEYFRNFAILH